MNQFKEIRVLNTIRASAALIVLISHYSNTSGLFDKVLGEGAGQLGVMIFFVLSGFLISHLYLDKPVSKHHIINYLIARIARVIPLYLFIVFTSFLIFLVSSKSIMFQIDSFDVLTDHLLFIEGVSVLWTIPVEIQYYFCFIICWYMFQKQPLLTVIFMSLIIVLTPLMGEHLNALNLHPALINFCKSLPFFLSGTVLAIGFNHWQNKKQWQSNWWFITIVGVLLIYPNISSHIFGQSIDLWFNLFVVILITLFFITWSFFTVISSQSKLAVVGDFLGKISYSIYLWHLPILYFFKSQSRDDSLMFLPLYVLLVILVSVASYLLIEKPSRRWIRKAAIIQAD